jgi:phosphatidylglycerol:prolipoprotein diacylglycerol transferase
MEAPGSAAAGFVHRIDPVLADLGGVYLWWYGLSYTLGFLNIWLYIRRHRANLRLSAGEADALVCVFCTGVLVGGRLMEVAFDEWAFYREHAALVPAVWLGGMATHGLLVGAAGGTWLFTVLYRKPFRELADAIVVPGALLMGLGRIGNFIDGQIVGSLTDGWWGVEFPDAEGSRHPVVLYDGLKNLLLVPYLAHVRRTNRTPGATAARFVFWYAFLRIFVDLFRDYPTHRLPLGTGQTLNLAMTAAGLVLLIRSRMRRLGRLAQPHWRPSAPRIAPAPLVSRVALVAILLVSLTIPSNWTQDVPARYAARHPGLKRSSIYPPIDTSPPRSPTRSRADPQPAARK